MTTVPTPPNSTYTGTDSDVPFDASITFEDAAGNDVAPDDIPVWATSDATIATISSTTADGTGATIAIAGRAGSCTITATSVNKSGTKIVLTGSIIIAAGDATQGQINLPIGPAAAAPPATVPPADPTAPSTSATPPADGGSTGSTTTSDAGVPAGTAAPAAS